ncbi:MAG: hypothetical protein Q3996_02130 [Candidatus Saccharibacteria bacterium]|nr:hypothetical protein [Candidatus Saccharibacteria bacterium]
MLIDIFGWAAGAFGVALGITQLRRLLSSRSVAGISLLMWQLYFGVQVGWIAHGLIENNQPMIWASLACVIMSTIVLFFYNKYKSNTRRVSNKSLFGMAIFWAVVFTLVAWKTSAEVKGLIFIFPTTFGQIHQLIKIHQAHNLSGLSPTMLLIYVFNQSLLLSWSFFLHDRTLMITSTTSILILMISLVRFYYKIKSLYKTRKDRLKKH